MEGQNGVHGELMGEFEVNGAKVSGKLAVDLRNGAMQGEAGGKRIEGNTIFAETAGSSGFVLHDVTIGIQFHWERKEKQTFRGNLRLVSDSRGITIINEIGVEEYLKSVIASEMSAESPAELLKAHAITSRSWLVAMLDRQKKMKNLGASQRGLQTVGEIIRWYDREDHALFDVCADDHCQRYQGILKIISSAADEAVEATRGIFLVHAGEICDARFSKACGGRTELFGNAWEEISVPYLQSVSDSETEHPVPASEEEAARWILGSPDVYCNTRDGKILKQVLPSFDQETADFFRWKVEYSQEEIAELLRAKSGIDFGSILDLAPLGRGPSGRIVSLKIVGSKNTVTVGKELEIRKWLSPSHLYSSAFVTRGEGKKGKAPARWILEGAGWGHGVGLCQIGAAVMAVKGKSAEEIVQHYFRGAKLMKLY
ncbi:MAG: SpoIID/LytB domain-containing protein [Ignavibacteriales bacterium]|nr:SpoIID/LytB domain-containing protein [Ignavibacteriales bacterium]